MLSRNKNKRQNSTASMANITGLVNKPGDNNCFLNSAIQVLWHLDVFRRSFRYLTGHACMGASCIFCALKDVFEQFQYSKNEALKPTVLRSALAETFQKENLFQLGLMYDAAECFENILIRIHVHISNTVRDDVCTTPHCIPHQKFGLTLMEQCVCACGATSEPLSFIEMVHYVSATALCAEDEILRRRHGSANSSNMFGKLIKVAGSMGDIKSCPSDCGAQIETRKVLMNCPDVVSIGIVWDSEEPDVRHIIDLVHALGTTLKLADLFHTVVDERANRLELYLVGMVCYYGKHYSTFFFHTKLRKWVYFDDAHVTEVGKRWSNVIDKCIKGHHQPLLLLYANPNAHPVSTSHAPTANTMLPGYSERRSQIYPSTKEPLPEFPETDSLNSEGVEVTSLPESLPSGESSGTESMQAVNTTSVSPFKSMASKRKSHKHVPSPSTRSEEKVVSNVSTQKPNKKEKKHHEEKPAKSRTNEERSKTPTKTNETAVVETTKQLKPDHGKPIAKTTMPKFTWKITEQNSGRKTGHYVEPNPAQWTTIKPYSNDKIKSDKRNVTSDSNNDSNSDLSKVDVSVKARDTGGMASFCVTRKSDPIETQLRQGTPSPSSSFSQSSQSIVRNTSMTSEGKRSIKSTSSATTSLTPTSSLYSKQANVELISQTSSASKPSDSGIGSHTSESSVTSATSTISQSNSDEGVSHAITDKSAVQTDKTVFNSSLPPTQTVKGRPPLPPKPPFLSLPLSEAVQANSDSKISVTNPHSLPAMATLAAMLQYQAQGPVVNPSNQNVNFINNSPAADKGATLLRDADDLIEQSVAADAIQDFSSALQLCLEATKMIETVMLIPDIPEQCMLQARIKHGECISRSRVLHQQKNMKHRSRGTHAGGTRLSMTEADRHMTSSVNRLPSSSLTHSAVKDEESTETKEVDGATTAADKRLTPNPSLENKIRQINEEQKRIEHHPSFREPYTAPKVNKSNANNNNCGRRLSATQPLVPQNDADEEKKKSRTNIFVWNNPDNITSEMPLVRGQDHQSPSDARNSIASSNTQVSVLSTNKMPSGSNEARRIDPSAIADERSRKNLSTQATRIYRSVTPPPQASADPPPSLAQQRRSKTPTPSLNKEMLRTRRDGAQRPSNSKARPKSTYDVSFSEKSSDSDIIPVAPPRFKAMHRSGSISEQVSTQLDPSSFVLPFPYPAWGAPPMMSPGAVSPSMFSPGYYPYFYHMFQQYYASLTPEERNMFHSSVNKPSPGTNPTFPANMAAAYFESWQNQHGNTSSASRTTAPNNRIGNYNIYEANKPRPFNNAVPATQDLSRGSAENPASRQQRNALTRKPPVENKRPLFHPRSGPISFNEALPDRPLEGLKANAGSHVAGRQTMEPTTSSPRGTIDRAVAQQKLREGMLKWADEGKKRVPDTNITAEHRSRLLQEFANRPRKNNPNPQPSAFQAYPRVKEGSRAPIIALEQNHREPIRRMMPSSDSSQENAPKHKCELCGLSYVAENDKYCSDCRAYLARFKPTVNSQRLAKK